MNHETHQEASREKVPTLCDMCSIDKPATRYDLPKGTILFDRGTLDGQNELMVSAGNMGFCAPCRNIFEVEGRGDRGARQVALRVVDANAKVAPISGPGRKEALLWLAKFWGRILPLLTNPRPFVEGAEPLDGEVVHFEPKPAPRP